MSKPTNTIQNLQHVTCFGLSDGEVEIAVTGGTPTYTFTWNPSVGTTAMISNLSPGTYTVTTTDAVGCTDELTVTINEPNQLVVSSTVNDANCGFQDGEITINATGGNGSYTYTWSPNVSSSNSASNLEDGVYDITVTDNLGCSELTQLTVGLVGNIPLTVSANTYFLDLIQSTNAELNADFPPGLIYDSIIWSPTTGLSCTNCTDPTASPTETTTYYATIYTSNGCIGRDSLTIVVEVPCSEVFVPTIFSPNLDGLNDLECVEGSCITDFEFTIFDRWGEVVFKSFDQNNCWDGNFRGKPAQTGVYVYKLKAMLKDGTSVSNSGNVQVVR